MTVWGCGVACGTVYKLAPGGPPWTETILYSFLGGIGDGTSPWAGVTWDFPISNTELYGTTSDGIAYSVP